MTRAARLLILLALAPRPSFSQERGVAALGAAVAGLGTTARVLMIGAHPDDEDTALLAWLARGRHVETAYLSLTRGDGGQNLIGNELGEALGVLRTEELLAARRIDGAHQYFSRAFDFGFSKSPEETFAHWPHNALLTDVVTVVRAFRPQVIVAVFSGTPRDGHGHHQVSGLLAREAYDAAGDTVRFPRNATQGLGGWTVAKFYRGAYFNEQNATLAVNVGEYDPLLGRSYAEIAAESRSQHKSQGFGVLRRKGPRRDYVRREATRVGAPVEPTAETSLFDGIDTTFGRLRESARDRLTAARVDSIAALVGFIRRTVDYRAPETIVPALARLATLAGRARPRCAATERCSTAAEDLAQSLEVLERRARQALVAATGLVLEADADRDAVARSALPPALPTAFDRDTLPVHIAVYASGTPAVAVLGARVAGSDMAATRSVVDRRTILTSDSVYRAVLSLAGATLTQPWWLRSPRRGDLFATPVSTVAEDEREPPGEADVSVSVDAEASVTDAGRPAPVHLRAPVVRRYAHPVRGEVSRPVSVVPPISVTLDRAVEYLPANTSVERTVRVSVRSGTIGAHVVTVRIALPRGLSADSTVRTVELSGFGAVRAVDFRVRGVLPPGRDTVRATAESNGVTYAEGYTPIEYDHTRPQKLYRPALLELEAVDVILPRNRRVAYVNGVGDNVAAALRALGLDITVLEPASIATTDLARFGAIVVGPRAYESSPALVASNARLLDFARAGGTLVVQYGQYEMTQPGIMPYPITLARPHDRVTVEGSPVRILDPATRILTQPNAIAQRDWEGWVQERALYMPHTHDPAYAAPLAMSDPGEPPNDGAILIAPLGRGTYVYTTLAFFRQLPAGVPGAARLFVNLIGAGAAAGAAAIP